MVNTELVKQIYAKLLLIRKVEELLVDLYPTDRIKSPVHLSIGQEAVSVGVCLALETSDIVFGTYRGHALYLSKGGNLKAMIAELYGKRTGCCRGKGGSMHLSDRSVNMMGTSAIVSTGIPQAVGYAFAQKRMNTANVVAVFFGDGAMEEGVYYESLNIAKLYELPILFICENNKYAINTPISKRTFSDNYVERAKAFGISAVNIKENNSFDVFSCVKQVVDSIRLNQSKGPFFLEVETYRWLEHVGPGDDSHFGYRSKEEIDSWIKRDELRRVESLLSSDDVTSIQLSVERDLHEAFEYAENSPFPSEEDLLIDTFA
jgi:TPP-dependent pyruvate/acetoin dehydrogenase alpha subunit